MLKTASGAWILVPVPVSFIAFLPALPRGMIVFIVTPVTFFGFVFVVIVVPAWVVVAGRGRLRRIDGDRTGVGVLHAAFVGYRQLESLHSALLGRSVSHGKGLFHRSGKSYASADLWDRFSLPRFLPWEGADKNAGGRLPSPTWSRGEKIQSISTKPYLFWTSFLPCSTLMGNPRRRAVWYTSMPKAWSQGRTLSGNAHDPPLATLHWGQ